MCYGQFVIIDEEDNEINNEMMIETTPAKQLIADRPLCFRELLNLFFNGHVATVIMLVITNFRCRWWGTKTRAYPGLLHQLPACRKTEPRNFVCTYNRTWWHLDGSHHLMKCP